MGLLAEHLVYASVFWLTAACCFVGVSAHDSDHAATNILKLWSCNDLKHERTVVHGVVEILGDLLCPEKRVSECARCELFLFRLRMGAIESATAADSCCDLFFSILSFFADCF